MKTLVMLVMLAGTMGAQTVTKSMFISVPPVNPPITYCSAGVGTVTLSTTWIGVALEDQSFSAKDTLTLSSVSGHFWQCSGALMASVAWTDSKNGDCRGYAEPNTNIEAVCNGNSCKPKSPGVPTDYTITWSNPACNN